MVGAAMRKIEAALAAVRRVGRNNGATIAGPMRLRGRPRKHPYAEIKQWALAHYGVSGLWPPTVAAMREFGMSDDSARKYLAHIRREHGEKRL